MHRISPGTSLTVVRHESPPSKQDGWESFGNSSISEGSGSKKGN